MWGAGDDGPWLCVAGYAERDEGSTLSEGYPRGPSSAYGGLRPWGLKGNWCADVL